MSARRCQYPVTTHLNPRETDTCDEKAAFYTDDLKAIHWLCEEHREEAAEMNSFEADPA